MSVSFAPVAAMSPFAGFRGIPARFPIVLTSIALLLLTGIGLGFGTSAEIPIVLEYREYLRLALFVFSFAVPATLAVALFGEARGWSAKRRALVSAAIFLPLVPLSMLADPSGGSSLIGVWIALWSLAVFSPALARGKTNQAFWSLSYGSIFCFAYGLLVACIVAVALTVIFGIIYDLIGYRISSSTKNLILFACLAAIWPTQVLARLPDPAEMPLDDRGPALLHKLFNWLVAPAACVTLLLLGAAVLESAVRWKLPDEDAILMFAVLLTACVGVWLAVFPLRGTGGRVLRVYYRVFPWILPLLAPLIAVFVYTQIAESGVTESRYILALLSAWLAATAIYVLISRTPKLVVAPAALAVLVLAGTIGPWGARSVSLDSQFGRLQAMLDSSGYIVEGRLAPQNGYADPAASRRIFDQVTRLRNDYGFDDLAGWLGSLGLTVERPIMVEDIVAQMGIDHVNVYEEKGNFFYSGNDGIESSYVRGGHSSVAGYDVAVDLRLEEDIENLQLSSPTAGVAYTVSYKDGILLIADAAIPDAVVRLDFRVIVQRLQNDDRTKYSYQSDFPEELMILDAWDNGLAVHFIAEFLDGRKSAGAYEIERVRGILLIGGAGLPG